MEGNSPMNNTLWGDLTQSNNCCELDLLLNNKEQLAANIMDQMGILQGSLTPYSSGIDSVGGTITETDSDNFSQLVTPLSETLESPIYDSTNNQQDVRWLEEDSVPTPGTSGQSGDDTVHKKDLSGHRSENCSCIMCDINGTVLSNLAEVIVNKLEEPIDNLPNQSVISKPSEPAIVRRRGRPKLPIYHSQISPVENGIKIKIKKSPPSQVSIKAPRKPAKPDKPIKHRKRKSVVKHNNETTKTKRRRKVVSPDPVDDASDDGESLGNWSQTPAIILSQVFDIVTREEGCLPFLLRACRVCRRWNLAALNPKLWHTMDLSNKKVKDKFKTEAKLIWLVQNRLTRVQELNVSGWNQAITSYTIQCIAENCAELRSIAFNGCWKVTGENLKLLSDKCPELCKLDLSNVTSNSSNPRSCLTLSSISETLEVIGGRLTHLVLANNIISSFPQVITAIASQCPNLVLLDLSNIKARTRGVLQIDIEKVQRGCPKLKVLRLTNSMIYLATTPLKDQVGSPGFPDLEEVSIAVDGKGYFSGMDDASVERILKTSNKLRLLDVRGCIRISDSSLVRVPAWDLEHLFVSGCYATKSSSDGLELIIRKWRHSLKEVDLSWTSATQALDLAVTALAEEENVSVLSNLDMCGSSVNFEPVRAVLNNCKKLTSLNLTSCRALPRGVKRLYANTEDITQLRTSVEGGRYDTKPDEESHNEDAGD